MADGERSDFSQPLWGLCHIGYDSARGSMRWGRAPNTHSAVERSQGDKPCQLGTSEARAARAYRGLMDDTPGCETLSAVLARRLSGTDRQTCHSLMWTGHQSLYGLLIRLRHVLSYVRQRVTLTLWHHLQARSLSRQPNRLPRRCGSVNLWCLVCQLCRLRRLL